VTPQFLLVGRRLMNVHKRLPDAIEIFKFNVADHPRSDHAFFLLGEAYERSGALKQAIESYKKSLTLNPKNWELADQQCAFAVPKRTQLEIINAGKSCS
jgi:tetratricopeptide (TPR) repeat protein